MTIIGSKSWLCIGNTFLRIEDEEINGILQHGKVYFQIFPCC